MAGRRRFHSLDDLCRYMANVMNRLEEGSLDDAGAKTRAYLANTLASIVKSRHLDDVAERVEALEAKVHARLH